MCVTEPARNIALDSAAKMTHTDYGVFHMNMLFYGYHGDTYIIFVQWAFNDCCHRNGARKHKGSTFRGSYKPMLQPNMVIHIPLIAKLKGMLMFHTCCSIT